MKKIVLCAFLLVSGVIFSASAENTPQDKTNAVVNVETRLNLRMKPTIKSAKAGSVKGGTRVQVTGVDGAWVEIVAPEQLKVYVSEVYLIDGKLANATNLRAGRSAEAPSFGLLPAGTALKAVGTGDRYGWVQVVPPETIRVYAFSDYITLDKNAVIADKTEQKKAEVPAAPAKEVKTVEETQDAVPVEAVESKKVEDKKDTPAPKKAETPKVEAKKTEVKKPAAAPVKEVKKAEEKKAAPAPKKVETKKAEAPKKAEVKKECKAAAPAEDAKLCEQLKKELIALGAEDAKEKITVAGTVVRITASTSIATDFAVLKDGKVNLGYICGKSKEFFSKFEGKEYTAEGKVYRIKGWKAPIVVVK